MLTLDAVVYKQGLPSPLLCAVFECKISHYLSGWKCDRCQTVNYKLMEYLKPCSPYKNRKQMIAHWSSSIQLAFIKTHAQTVHWKLTCIHHMTGSLEKLHRSLHDIQILCVASCSLLVLQAVLSTGWGKGMGTDEHNEPSFSAPVHCTCSWRMA